VRVKLWYPLTMHAITERLKDISCICIYLFIYRTNWLRCTNVNDCWDSLQTRKKERKPKDIESLYLLLKPKFETLVWDQT